MLEPTTISVPNLAARWNQTQGDILEHAAHLRLCLLFNFDGLAFDFNDKWLPDGKDWGQRRELEALTDFVKRADGAASLRTKVNAAQTKIQILNDLFDDRDRKRQQKHYRGALMAGPETVDELLRLGFAKHPFQAYRPEGPFCLREIDGVPVLDGPIVWLEPGGTRWKERLEPADMVVSMEAVKAIEAAVKPWQTAPATDTPTPVPVVTAGASGGVEPATGKRWTPEKLAELKSYREKHGTKKAAEFFGVAEQLIRKKLPSEKPQPKGYSAFTYRPK